MIKSIARSLIDRNIDRRFTVKLLFSQKPKPIRLVAGGGLIGYIKTISSLNIQKSANEYAWQQNRIQTRKLS